MRERKGRVKMKQGARMKQVWKGLTARQRAILLLRSWKVGEVEDELVRDTMPRRQEGQFSHYVGMVGKVNRSLGGIAIVYGSMVDGIEVRMGWLNSLWFWGAGVRKLVADECYEEEADLTELTPDEAWERLLAEKRTELETLLARGELEGVEIGGAPHIRLGSFYGWRGELVPVRNEEGMEYVVAPDGGESEVSWRRGRLDEVWEVRRDAPTHWGKVVSPLLGGSYWDRVEAADELGVGDIVGKALMEAMRGDIEECWAGLMALGVVMEEVGFYLMRNVPILAGSVEMTP